MMRINIYALLVLLLAGLVQAVPPADIDAGEAVTIMTNLCRYASMIEDLREGAKVTTTDISRLLQSDPNFVTDSNASGHLQGHSALFPSEHFGVQVHVNRDLTPSERKDYWKQFQCFINVIKSHAFNNEFQWVKGAVEGNAQQAADSFNRFRRVPAAFATALQIEQTRFDQYITDVQ